MKPGKYIISTHSSDEHSNPTAFAIIDLSQKALRLIELRREAFMTLNEADPQLIEMVYEDRVCIFYDETASFLLEAIVSKEDIDGFWAQEFIPFDETKLKTDVRAKLEELSMGMTQSNMTLSITKEALLWSGRVTENGEIMCYTADLWVEDFTKNEANN